jgi:hypothetical protein
VRVARRNSSTEDELWGVTSERSTSTSSTVGGVRLSKVLSKHPYRKYVAPVTVNVNRDNLLPARPSARMLFTDIYFCFLLQW